MINAEKLAKAIKKNPGLEILYIVRENCLDAYDRFCVGGTGYIEIAEYMVDAEYYDWPTYIHY